MIKTAGRATPILNYICVILLFAIFALQLMPGYWNCQKEVEVIPTEIGAEPYTITKDISVSIQQMIWFPANEVNLETPSTDMVEYFEKLYKSEKWEVADVATMPVLIVVCCIISFFFGIKKPTRLWMNIGYLLGGGLALVSYLTMPIFQLNTMWVVHAAVSGALVLVSIANIAFRPWKRIVHYMKTGE